MKQIDLSPLESAAISAATRALSQIIETEGFTSKPINAQNTLKAIAIAKPIAMHILEVPVTTIAPMVAYITHGADIAETAVSYINENHPINVQLTLDLIRQFWFTRFNITNGNCTPEAVTAILKASPFLNGAIKELV